MRKRDEPKEPWGPMDYFTNGAILLVIGVLLINGGEIAPLGFLLAMAGGVMVLVGAIKKGTESPTQTPPD